ncbi:hypothetical protein DFQ13_11563 [Actinokineospora spheciospongiae]|nr:hypothetical protein DFQ13_11563 [Actinokineospora spheciospongiae]
MSPARRPEWEVRAYGSQLSEIDTDLMAQIVVMLGRELLEREQQTKKGDYYEQDNS